MHLFLRVGSQETLSKTDTLKKKKAQVNITSGNKKENSRRKS